MSASNEIVGKRQAAASLNFFERDLTVWVALCIAVGIGLGLLFPALVQAIDRMEFAQVNLPVGVLNWAKRYSDS